MSLYLRKLAAGSDLFGRTIYTFGKPMGFVRRYDLPKVAIALLWTQAPYVMYVQEGWDVCEGLVE